MITKKGLVVALIIIISLGISLILNIFLFQENSSQKRTLAIYKQEIKNKNNEIYKLKEITIIQKNNNRRITKKAPIINYNKKNSTNERVKNALKIVTRKDTQNHRKQTITQKEKELIRQCKNWYKLAESYSNIKSTGYKNIKSKMVKANCPARHNEYFK